MSNKKNSELSPILNPKFFDDFVTPKEKEMVLNLDSNFLNIDNNEQFNCTTTNESFSIVDKNTNTKRSILKAEESSVEEFNNIGTQEKERKLIQYEEINLNNENFLEQNLNSNYSVYDGIQIKNQAEIYQLRQENELLKTEFKKYKPLILKLINQNEQFYKNEITFKKMMKDMEFFKSSNELEALKKENIRLNRRNLFLENRNFELEQQISLQRKPDFKQQIQLDNNYIQQILKNSESQHQNQKKLSYNEVLKSQPVKRISSVSHAELILNQQRISNLEQQNQDDQVIQLKKESLQRPKTSSASRAELILNQQRISNLEYQKYEDQVIQLKKESLQRHKSGSKLQVQQKSIIKQNFPNQSNIVKKDSVIQKEKTKSEQMDVVNNKSLQEMQKKLQELKKKKKEFDSIKNKQLQSKFDSPNQLQSQRAKSIQDFNSNQQQNKKQKSFSTDKFAVQDYVKYNKAQKNKLEDQNQSNQLVADLLLSQEHKRIKPYQIMSNNKIIKKPFV